VNAVKRVVIVNFTTLKRWSDTSCVLKVGDHPFISHDTCVAYQYAEVVATADLHDRLGRGELSLREPIDNEVLLRVLDGASLSKFLPLRCHRMLREQGLIY
jgi:hypothetical protein